MKFFQFNRRRGIVALVLLLALLAGAFFVIYPRYQARRKAKSGSVKLAVPWGALL